MEMKSGEDAVLLVKEVRRIAEVGIVNARADKQVLNDAADLLETLDERVAIMSEFEEENGTSSVACGDSFPSRGSLLARLLAAEELTPCAAGGGCYWIEFAAGHCYPGMVVEIEGNDFKIVFAVILRSASDAPIRRLYADNYGKTWCCWTARPTEERRRETPWSAVADDYDEHRHSGLLEEE